MADIHQTITLGLGTPGDIPHLLWVGLSSAVVVAPELSAANADLYVVPPRATTSEPERVTAFAAPRRETMES